MDCRNGKPDEVDAHFSEPSGHGRRFVQIRKGPFPGRVDAHPNGGRAAYGRDGDRRQDAVRDEDDLVVLFVDVPVLPEQGPAVRGRGAGNDGRRALLGPRGAGQGKEQGRRGERRGGGSRKTEAQLHGTSQSSAAARLEGRRAAGPGRDEKKKEGGGPKPSPLMALA